MKVLSAMECAQGNKVAVLGRVAATENISDARNIEPDMFEWRLSVKVGCTLTAPMKGVEEVRRRARRVICHEIFGELVADLTELRSTLYSEDVYREPDDPALAQIEALIEKVTPK